MTTLTISGISGLGFIFLAAACGGGEPPAKTPADTAKTPPASSASPAVTAPPKPSAWALPEGPRDAEKGAPAVTPYKTETWRAATGKVKGVPAPGKDCAEWQKKSAADTELATAKKAGAAPPECTDAIVDKYLAPNRAEVTDEGGHMVVGLSLAGRLARTAQTAPVMKDASDKEKVKKFIQGPLRTWMVEQATAIDTLSIAGATLAPIGRSIVATEAGMADLRLVDKIRSAPTPSTWDKELKAVYEAALDEALEPRKTRGRDAALVGLSDFAALGVTSDARVTRARALLSKMYGGRRVDALDNLAMPKETAADKKSLERFEAGKKYWRRVDFVEAAHAAAKEEGDESRLILAVSLALAKGPASVKDMMAAPSPAALGLDHTEALDDLAAQGGKYAGEAAFDAAYLRSLSVPDGDKAPAYLADVAARAKKAASTTTDPETKKKAETLAADSEAAAKATK